MVNGREIGVGIAVLFALFLIATIFVPSKVMIELTRIVHLSIVTAVLVSYARPGYLAFKRKFPNGSHILLMGISLGILSDILYSWWMLFWRLSGQPPWIVNSDVTGFAISMASVSWLCFLAAPDAIEGHIPPKNMVLIGAGVGVGLLLMITVFLYSFDLSGVAEWIRPYLIEPDNGYGKVAAFLGINHSP